MLTAEENVALPLSIAGHKPDEEWSATRCGEAFTIRTPAGEPRHLRVVGVFQPPRLYELLGAIVISKDAFDRKFARPANQLTLVDGSVSKAALERSLAPIRTRRSRTRTSSSRASRASRR
jgi:hypothetical protein